MGLAINNNITALNAWRQLTMTDKKMGASMEKLSSGLRINRAADDPAGLVISEKMRAQLTGLSAASKNVEKAINFMSTAEAALDKVNVLLNKMRSLAIDSANLGVNDQAMLDANQAEIDEAIDSITRIAEYTQFGTKKLLDGSLDGVSQGATAATGSTVTFQVGANEGQAIEVDITSMQASALAKTDTANGGVDIEYTLVSDGSTANVSTSFEGLHDLRTGELFTDGAFASTSTVMAAALSSDYSSVSNVMGSAVAIIDQAIEEVSTLRGKLGAIQADNLEVNLDALRVSFENLQAAESTIRDTDMSREMAEFTKFQIMMQAGTAMLAQANQLPNNVLQLLR